MSATVLHNFPSAPAPRGDEDFVHQALAAFLEAVGYPANYRFDELSTGDQSAVLRHAQQLKEQASVPRERRG